MLQHATLVQTYTALHQTHGLQEQEAVQLVVTESVNNVMDQEAVFTKHKMKVMVAQEYAHHAYQEHAPTEQQTTQQKDAQQTAKTAYQEHAKQ